MCLTMPARVVAVTGGWAQVEIGGHLRRASTLPVPDVRPGDWAVVTAGTLVRILEPEIAEQIIAALHVAGAWPRPPDGGDLS
jgi:hydrogenase assembly chaperone HypC/HupF